MKSVVFNIQDVNKIFKPNTEAEVIALKNINLQISEGEFLAIVGPSGSGKSTLLNIMSGFDKPSSGSAYLANKELESMNDSELSQFRRDHIGFIFQSYNLIPVLTVKENVEYVMILQGIDKHQRNLRVEEYLNIVGLEGKENRLPSELSGGQQQRVAVARAMVSNPDIVIADEPTANLDSQTGYNLINMMLKLNEDFGKTFVFSTHDPKIMEKAKRLVTLKDGCIEKDEHR